jgi:flagella basal body P-ring formation protein FlgA
MKTLAILVVVTGCMHAACVAVPSDKILARDLAAAVPLFQALDPESVIGYAPLPGTERVLSSRDLFLAARLSGLSFSAGDLPASLCIERLVRPLSLDAVREALLSAFDSLDRSQIALDIVGFSNQPLPPGRLVFSLAALNKPALSNPQTPIVWPGKLIYAETSSLSVWAKVLISVDAEVFVAKTNIPKGEIIRAEQIATTHVRQFPSLESKRWSGSSIVGRIARRAIPEGQKIEPQALEVARDVIQGETVHVKVIDGAATITLDGIAQSSGTKGDSILVHNPASGKSFRGVIEDRSQILVVPDPQSTPLRTPVSIPGSNL